MAIAQRTRKIPWTRAADRCAICRCRLTKDPRNTSDREAVLGMECHIVARRKGGPRSGSIKTRELDEYPNLILLCPTHHKEIDDQPAEYTIEKLREVKRKHEEWVDETLEWRATLPDALWQKIKEQAEEMLRAEVGDVDEETAELLERLGAYVLLTAEFLLAPEMTLFIRGENAKVSLGFKYEQGAVLFNFAEGSGFDAGFEAFERAPVVEAQTDEVIAYQEADQELMDSQDEGLGRFIAATAALRAITERTAPAEAVFYVRDTQPSDRSELGFRVDGDDVLFAAGPSESFAAAHETFAAQRPVDATQAIRARMFFDKFEKTKEHRDPRAIHGFLANTFALSVLPALEPLEVGGRSTGDLKAAFATHARNQFFEALLMLKAADGAGLDDPRIRAWAEDHADPDAPDGLRAVLPNACREAIDRLAEESELDGEEQAELDEDALGLLYKTIDGVLRFDEDEEAQEALATLLMEGLEWWGEPDAREEITELALKEEN